ncbi:MAG: radical SAM protein [bacterium]|nr:radical SAM protein [bacterium]
MIDILCVNPKNEFIVVGCGTMPPVGLLCLAAILEREGYAVKVVDLDCENIDIKGLIEEQQPKIVCITGTTPTRFQSFELAHICKTVDSSIVTGYGGPHATFTAEEILADVPDMDVIVRNEGDQTVVDLAKAVIDRRMRLDDVLGISYRKGSNIQHNHNRPRIQDLDLLPFPARHLVKMSNYDLKMDFLDVPGTYIMTSRGCPMKCSFCSAKMIWGSQYTKRSAKNVADEIEMLFNKYNVAGIKIFDSTLTIDRGHVESLCDEFMRRGFDFPWECEIRVNTMDRSLLEKMKKAGCYYVDFGVESASPKVLKLMRKGITLEQVENVLNWTSELGIYTKVFFTYGHIGETWEDVQMTKRFIKEHQEKISLVGGGVGIQIYPGTLVEQYAREKGYLPPDFSWTKPYYNEENEFLSSPPNTPLLCQPQMGFPEFRRLRSEHLSKNLFSPGAIWRKIKQLRSPSAVKQNWKFFTGALRTALERRRA